MSFFFGQVEVEIKEESPTSFCTSLVCICGNNCHNNPAYHTQITGSLSQDDRKDGEDLAAQIAALRGTSWHLQLKGGR